MAFFGIKSLDSRRLIVIFLFILRFHGHSAQDNKESCFPSRPPTAEECHTHIQAALEQYWEEHEIQDYKERKESLQTESEEIEEPTQESLDEQDEEEEEEGEVDEDEDEEEKEKEELLKEEEVAEEENEEEEDEEEEEEEEVEEEEREVEEEEEKEGEEEIEETDESQKDEELEETSEETEKEEEEEEEEEEEAKEEEEELEEVTEEKTTEEKEEEEKEEEEVDEEEEEVDEEEEDEEEEEEEEKEKDEEELEEKAEVTEEKTIEKEKEEKEEEEEDEEEEEEEDEEEEDEEETEKEKEEETKEGEQTEEVEEEEEEEQLEEMEEKDESYDKSDQTKDESISSKDEFQDKESKIITDHLAKPPAGNETSTVKDSFERIPEETSDEAYLIGVGMAQELSSEESATEQPITSETEEDEEEKEEKPVIEEEEEEEVKQPKLPLRDRDHIDELLGLNEIGTQYDQEDQKFIHGILHDLKKIYENAIKPLEMIFKYRDISTRALGDAEIYAKPMVLFVGPWSSGKTSVINYLLNTERTSAALKTGPEPTDVDFTLIKHGEEHSTMAGSELTADWAYSSVQKFGQGFLEHFKGVQYPHRLLQKLTLVDTPGIMENRKPQDRGYPFNDAFQWFIDRADAIYVVFDPSKLEIGSELESLLDQLKGREAQIRFILNKADTIRRSDIMKVIGQLFWNLSPLMGSSEAPVIYAVSLMTKPFHPGSPAKFLLDQEMTFLSDLRETIDRGIENRILYARRHAVRVRNHAKMVDCYLATYYKHKSIFSNRKKIADQITENPDKYSIYQGLSTLTNVSRYDLPDPDIYREFFNLHPLYDFKPLQSTCSYFRGCPLDKLDIAISYDLPDLLRKYKKHFNKVNSTDQKEDDKTR